MNSGLLITGGEAPPFSAIEHRLGDFSVICAADSGLDVARSWGLRPDIVVGDMDSLSDASTLANYADVRVFPRDKDETDTEIGIRVLRARGLEFVVVAGGGGGRIDHLLAIRALFERPTGPDEWITNRERLVRVTQETGFRVGTGATISVFPLTGAASSMRSEGLKWPLSGLVWGLDGFGVSNEAVSDTITIVPGTGPLLVVVPLIQLT